MKTQEIETTLYRCIDAMSRAVSQQVPNPQGMQVGCRLCKGHFAGALGWFHKPTLLRW